MQPFKIGMYVYANSEQEAGELERILHEFVKDNYDNGYLVTASKIGLAVQRFGKSAIVKNFLV